MQERACCFTGHRHIRPEDRELLPLFLEEAIKEAIRQGIDTFIVGGALGFDTMAALAVLKKKRVLPHLKLVLAIPCEGQSKYWSPAAVALYEEVRRHADEVQVLSPFYHSGCMHHRNRYMVDRSQLCVAYLLPSEEGGGTRYTVDYAQKQGRRLILYSREEYACKES